MCEAVCCALVIPALQSGLENRRAERSAAESEVSAPVSSQSLTAFAHTQIESRAVTEIYNGLLPLATGRVL